VLTVPAFSPIGVPLIPGVPRAAHEQTTYGTVLFANLHGYDALVEQLPPADAAALLGEFFAVLTSATLECGGQIFDLAECEMIAGFGVGDSRHTQIHEALMAARMIQQRFAPISASWSSKHSIEIGVGIGLNRGEVAIGIFGPPERAALTLVGDTANVAAQLCRRARAGEILLSAAVPPPQEFVLGGTDSGGAIPFVLLRHLHLGGRSAPVDVWCAAAPTRLQCRRTRLGRATHH
jgi:class 3 adenylate cyclase